ncbi:hypothetical protein N7489_011654 [Penicillium chrysogenum]|uniref:uncharacterized protein n=1 Tax=Penicillium chrysogenum TaxID=5076 RepID=UPI0024DF07C0|nr:uncharacterized protein N7489_011654 [Penicillium chrysogenum]KAJ5230946.1 hypothetical protein N7489_011654 [Penicillium chrysogenum]
MAFKLSLLLSLHLAGAWATNEPCLDPNAATSDNKASCCAGSGTGQASVGGVLYEYTCNSFAESFGPIFVPASNVYECAKACSADTTCHASSWQPLGNGGACWKSTGAFQLHADPSKQWVILVNTERAGQVVTPLPPIVDLPPVPDCQEEINQAKQECQTACDAGCDSQKEDIHHQCTDEMNNLKAELEHSCQDQVKAEIDTCQKHADEKCSSDKSLLQQSLQAECEKQISDLNKKLQAADADKEKCQKDKEKVQKELLESKTMLEKEKLKNNPAPSKPVQKPPSDKDGLDLSDRMCNRKNSGHFLNDGSTKYRMGYTTRVMPLVDKAGQFCTSITKCEVATFNRRTRRCSTFKAAPGFGRPSIINAGVHDYWQDECTVYAVIKAHW